MIKQNLRVSKARIPITNTPPNQLAKAILHSFSWSFKTLKTSEAVLFLLLPSLLRPSWRTSWCAIIPVRSLQEFVVPNAGASAVTQDRPRGFCRGEKQNLNTLGLTCFLKALTSFSIVGLQHRCWVLFKCAFTLLLTFKETLGIKFC